MGFYGCVLEKIDRSIYASYVWLLTATRCASFLFSNPSRLLKRRLKLLSRLLSAHGRLSLVPLIQGLFSLKEKAKTTVL